MVGALSLLPGGVCWAAQKTVSRKCGMLCDFYGFKLYVLALVRWPSLHSYDACGLLGSRSIPEKLQAKSMVKTSFSPNKGFSV